MATVQTITIPKGATLSGLAKQYGTTVPALMAANPQIKDPNLIYAGASLNIPSPYVAEMQKQLEPEKPPTVSPTITGTATGTTTGTDTYDINKIQSELAAASTEKKKAYEEMLGLQAKLYDTEYEKAGLSNLKAEISNLDAEISKRKAQRDQALLDEKGKPIPQWMITGRKALEIEAATNDINRLIEERNNKASQYNAGINEIAKKVNYAITDAQTKYSFWEKEEARLTNQLTNYQAELARQLKAAEEKEQWEKEYALKLEEARTPKTKELQAIKDQYTGRIIGYFNPETGESYYYPQKEETGAAGAGAGVEEAMTDEEIRAEIVAGYDRGYNYNQILDQIKKTIGPGAERDRWIRILKEEENKRKTAGFWTRLITPGI